MSLFGYITTISWLYHYYFLVLSYSATIPTISLIFSTASPYFERAT